MGAPRRWATQPRRAGSPRLRPVTVNGVKVDRRHKRVAASTGLLHACPVACRPASAAEQPFLTSARPLTPPLGRRAAPEPLPSCPEAHATPLHRSWLPQ